MKKKQVKDNCYSSAKWEHNTFDENGLCEDCNRHMKENNLHVFRKENESECDDCCECEDCSDCSDCCECVEEEKEDFDNLLESEDDLTCDECGEEIDLCACESEDNLYEDIDNDVEACLEMLSERNVNLFTGDVSIKSFIVDGHFVALISVAHHEACGLSPASGDVFLDARKAILSAVNNLCAELPSCLEAFSYTDNKK